jgi:site-specific DNA recombinase
MKIYAYLRVSGKGQVTGHGFDRQLDTIQSFCNKKGYQIDQVFKEQVSGTKDETDRPEFTAMVTAILKNGVDTIIVESLDRIARELMIQEQLLIYLASKNINLIPANTGENVTKAITGDPMKKALVQMQGIFSELDKSLLVKKLRKSREKVRKEKVKREGRKGYKETDDGKVILQEIRRLRRKNKGKVIKTFNEVAVELNKQGHLNTAG